MKKGILVLLFAIFGFGIFFFWTHKNQKSVPISVQPSKTTPSPTPTPHLAYPTTTLFVPYWAVTTKSLPTTYNTLAYFGITANTSGINTKEDGYLALPKFERVVNDTQKTLLVVRLIDTDVDAKVLVDKNLQQKVIASSIATAQQYKFDGIILDFEYNALAFDSVVNNITQFSQSFAVSSHNAKLTYGQLVYGDTFYLLRPFDAQKISQKADNIFIMAYDFHKANGNPGPNFPLHMLPDADYSFTQMIVDFTKKVPYQKITVVFGMFGYDWTLNNKKDSISPGVSVTTSEAEQMFAAPCKLKNCSITRDNKAEEEHGIYTDSKDQEHAVWFEDETSVQKKQAYLKTQGISSTGFWAYSYF